MTFSKAPYTADKDQLRSFKSRVQLKINSTLRPRSQPSFVSSPTSSAMQSECSTLVDFVIDEVEDDIEELNDATELDSENSAWLHDAPRSVKSHPQSKSRRLFRSTRARQTKPTNPSGIEPQMLDPEDRAWM